MKRNVELEIREYRERNTILYCKAKLKKKPISSTQGCSKLMVVREMKGCILAEPPCYVVWITHTRLTQSPWPSQHHLHLLAPEPELVGSYQEMAAEHEPPGAGLGMQGPGMKVSDMVCVIKEQSHTHLEKMWNKIGDLLLAYLGELALINKCYRFPESTWLLPTSHLGRLFKGLFLPKKQLNSKSQVIPHLFAENKLVNFGNAK